jgi:hypothetical protein
MMRAFHLGGGMRIGSCSLLFALALGALPGPAQAIGLDELLAKNLAARGGASVGKLQSLRLTGRAILSESDWKIEAAWGQVQKRPGKIRSEITLQGLTQVGAWDGKEGWKLEPFGGRRDPERGEGRRTYEKTGPTSGVLITYDAPPATPGDCLTVVGWHERAIELSGGRNVKVSQAKCRSRGDRVCQYDCRWE